MENKMSDHKVRLVAALRTQYEGELQTAKTNFLVYVENPCGVGDHNKITETTTELVKDYESALSKLEALEELSPWYDWESHS